MTGGERYAAVHRYVMAAIPDVLTKTFKPDTEDSPSHAEAAWWADTMSTHMLTHMSIHMCVDMCVLTCVLTCVSTCVC